MMALRPENSTRNSYSSSLTDFFLYGLNICFNWFHDRLHPAESLIPDRRAQNEFLGLNNLVISGLNKYIHTSISMLQYFVMTRLPTPGGDKGTWGEILNNYLGQAHDANGNIKAGAVSGSAIQDGSVTPSKLSQAYVTRLIPSGDTTGAADPVAIQSAINTGGLIVLSAGTYYINTPIIMKSNAHIWGTRGATILQLVNGANCDVIQGQNFLTLTGNGGNSSNSGIARWSVRDLIIDGNRANQSAASYGIRVYGYDYDLTWVTIRNCYTDGLYTEWGSDGSPTDSMESRLQGLKIHDCGNWGWHCRGPHDSICTDSIFWQNNQSGGTGGGIWAESDGTANGSGTTNYSAGGLMLENVHTWGGSHNWGIVLDTTAYLSNVQVEGAIYGMICVRADAVISGGRLFYPSSQDGNGAGLQLGDDGTTVGLPFTASVGLDSADIDIETMNFKGLGASSAALRWANANSCRVRILARMKTATATAIWGTPDSNSLLVVQGTAASATQAQVASMSQELSSGPYRRNVGGANTGFTIANGNTDLMNLNSNSLRFEHINGVLDRWYSDAYGTITAEISGASGYVRPGTSVGAGARIYSGSGAPTLSATAGDFYFRTDTPGTVNQRLYVCAGGTSWTGIL